MQIHNPGGLTADVFQVDLTFSLTAEAMDAGDLVADLQELVGVFPKVAGKAKLVSFTLCDQDDQGVALVAVFANASTSLGTEGGAPNISDANALGIVGHVPIAATDYVDVGGAKICTIRNINLWMTSAASTSAWVGIVNLTGTPTYSAAGIKGKFIFERTS